MERVMNSGICRCCASEGSFFKDLSSKHQWMGEDEVYADMLRECFDISLQMNESGEDSGICEVCITQLRNASNFKKQVLQTEENFRKGFTDRLFKNNIVKVEVNQLEYDVHVSDDNNHSDDYSDDEYEVPIKSEVDESKGKKRKKATTTRSKKPKVEAAESSKSKSGANIRKRAKKDPEEKRVDSPEKYVPEMKKQLHNLNTVLKYSNATPFKDRNDAGYVCAYCYKTFPDPQILRSHTQIDHGKEKPSYKGTCGIATFIALLDIVDLKCTLCDRPLENIDLLREHLVKEHNKKYYFGLTDYVQPFKLTNEQQVGCCLCDQMFHNMKLLMMHMNNHYRNFICAVCGAGFVNSFRLSRHEMTHDKKKSSFPCRHCGEVFEVESKRKAHVNTVHKGVAGDSVCQLCKARFKNYYQKTRHMIQVHNAEGIKCDMCERKFHLKSNLMLHMRQVHLKERSYECSVNAGKLK